MFSKILTLTGAALVLGLTVNDVSAKTKEYHISIKEHRFTPERLTVPAGEKIKLRVKNEDLTPEEFESHDLNREKIIGGGKTGTIFVGPLEPGEYYFFGEFNEDTAKGWITAE